MSEIKETKEPYEVMLEEEGGGEVEDKLDFTNHQENSEIAFVFVRDPEKY